MHPALIVGAIAAGTALLGKDDAPTGKCQTLAERWIEEEKIVERIVADKLATLETELNKRSPNVTKTKQLLSEIRNLQDYLAGHIRATRIEVDRASNAIRQLIEIRKDLETKV